MKALMIEAEGVTRFHDVPEQSPGRGEVRVAVRHVGLCGSDLSTFRGLNPLVTLPRIPGHEIGGEITELGTGVSGHYAIGRRVIAMPYTACGTCTACRKNRPNACRFNRTLGVQQDGGLAEQIILPAEKLIVNDRLDARFLALVEPLAVGFHAVARGRVQAKERVAVIGCGMIGMGIVIGAVARGAEVIAVDPSDKKTAIARRFGASHICNPDQGDLIEEIASLTADDGVDAAFEAVGLPLTFVQAIGIAGYAGRVVYVGYSKAPVTYQTQVFNLKELDIMGSRNATVDDFGTVIDYLESIGSEAEALISKIVPFAEAESALPYWDAHRNVLKVVVAR
jgi:threonine dehydrogenase-like Zn-dependent dehydrogenase